MIVTRRITAYCLTPDVRPLTVELVYDPHDPYSVTVLFVDADRDWELGRELLDAALDAPAGIGDVRMWPCGAGLWMVLDSPDGQALLRLRHDQVARFLAATYRAVPRGTERIDVDAVLGALLDGAS